MLTHNLGYPRIGEKRELKHACEKYWSEQLPLEELISIGRNLRFRHWTIQKESGLDLIPCNDFSFYDQVLDLSLTVDAIPSRYRALADSPEYSEIDLLFAMARGRQRQGSDCIAMEMTKWFDTNYHYIVPELTADQTFQLRSTKVVDEFLEAKSMGLNAKPVLIGPVSYLLLARPVGTPFSTVSLLERLLPVYVQLLTELQKNGAEWVQLDEPFLCLDLDSAAAEAFRKAYAELSAKLPQLKILVATYFEQLRENIPLALSLPVSALHLDLVRGEPQLAEVLQHWPQHLMFSCGLVDGRNIWRNDFSHSLAILSQAIEKLGEERVLLAPSCSLLHVPYDLGLEARTASIPTATKQWLAFAKQKLEELKIIRGLALPATHSGFVSQFKDNILAMQARKTSPLIHRTTVKERVSSIHSRSWKRPSPFPLRREKQARRFALPLLPTTTIGSFPQTAEVRKTRQLMKSGEISEQDYTAAMQKDIRDAIDWQERIGIDVLVHGEFERNDMVEYFGEQLQGFAFSKHGWVQSYGSRCVKPPIIFGDVAREKPMTVRWSSYAAAQTEKPVKGMLTGPVTILQWSFVRDDQPRSDTCYQLALAIHDEVLDLEKSGIGIIQIDEAALREGLPLRKADRPEYLRWAINSFLITCADVADDTQIHTHMCYSKFNDIIHSIAEMDADVITIETSRAHMQLLDAFAEFRYPNDIGPGVYDIHSPRIPSTEEIMNLLSKAMKVIPAERLWVNPDCGLKTRAWPETRAALENMVAAAKNLRRTLAG
jgi:5-methyltetrahydropteroyltriglutamate--homocysteine methyltransferase